MVEKRKSMHVGVINKYRKYPVFMRSLIPYVAEIEKMGLHRRPVGANGTRSTAARAYELLWNEIIDRRFNH